MIACVPQHDLESRGRYDASARTYRGAPQCPETLLGVRARGRAWVLYVGQELRNTAVFVGCVLLSCSLRVAPAMGCDGCRKVLLHSKFDDT
jgi:hypothetical protein